MKSVLVLLLLFICSTSCKDNSKTSDATTVQAKSIMGQSSTSVIGEQEIKTKLSKTTPYSKVEFNKAFPKSINSMPLDTEVSIVKQQGYATYGNEAVSLTVYDCAENNSGMAGLFFTAYTNKAQDDKQTKYIYKERNGIKTITTYRTDKNQCKIIFLYRNRWYTTLKGMDMNPDQLWNAFDINLLGNFKN